MKYSSDQEIKEIQSDDSPASSTLGLGFSGRWIWLAIFSLIIIGVIGYRCLFQGKADMGGGISKEIVEIKMLPARGDTAGVIELSNGIHFPFATYDTGLIATQNGITLYRRANGQLVYGKSRDSAGELRLTNKVIALPKRPLAVTLPDSSNVQLDPLAELAMDISQLECERSVSVTGQAYFSVPSKRGGLFNVYSNGAKIETTGSKFIVKSYEGGPTTISLEKGLLTVTKGSKFTRLKVGDVVNVHPGEWFEWKSSKLRSFVGVRDNVFYFEDDNLEAIKNEIEQWYAVRLKLSKYGDNSARYHFGPVSRNLPLGKVLGKLNKLTGDRFSVVEFP
ncbi:FecR family protein [Paraflavitalea pollutisoli]|uniref:FecR family protein n=1 Tax=Paraflavitalea pollutisoli TaxID=3034143 RepID=UPI0023EBE3B4|nr:FecR family protein [Paraflavitalea sp. H1-2-19X]